MVRNSTVKKDEEKKEDAIETYVDKLSEATGIPKEVITSSKASADIDYEELCIQLKAATGEISRLQEEFSKQTALLKHSEEESIILGDQVDALHKQLDQECDTNVKLKDKLTEYKETTIHKDRVEQIKVLEEKLEHFEQISNENSVLQEKLALCDGWYKTLQGKFMNIKVIVDDPFKE